MALSNEDRILDKLSSIEAHIVGLSAAIAKMESRLDAASDRLDHTAGSAEKLSDRLQVAENRITVLETKLMIYAGLASVLGTLAGGIVGTVASWYLGKS